jgi:2-haloacid dehalogenase
MNRRIVVFDLGGVLIDWNPRHLYRKLIADTVEMERFLTTVCTPAWNAQQDAGRPLAEAVSTLSAAHPQHAAWIAAYYDRWEEMIAGALAETVEILEALARARVPLFALSNWSAETFPAARQMFPFLSRFDGIVISGEVRVNKPDPRIFRALTERYRVVPEEAVFVDDVAANVDAATALGFHGVPFTTAAALVSELAALGLPV